MIVKKLDMEHLYQEEKEYVLYCIREAIKNTKDIQTSDKFTIAYVNLCIHDKVYEKELVTYLVSNNKTTLILEPIFELFIRGVYELDYAVNYIEKMIMLGILTNEAKSIFLFYALDLI